MALTWMVSRGGCGGSDDGLGGEIERNAEDIGVFHIEEALLI
jgi:hypothetical protein